MQSHSCRHIRGYMWITWYKWLSATIMSLYRDMYETTRVQFYCIDSDIKLKLCLWMMGDWKRAVQEKIKSQEPAPHSLVNRWGASPSRPSGSSSLWGWVMLHSALVWDAQARNAHTYRKKRSCLRICASSACVHIAEQQRKSSRHRWRVTSGQRPDFQCYISIMKMLVRLL